jgi:hypothetical protein
MLSGVYLGITFYRRYKVMKKQSMVLLVVLATLLLACITSAAAQEISPYAGEYDCVSVNMQGEEVPYYEFIVDEDGFLHGMADESGMTAFEGQVAEDGKFTAVFARLGGEMSGTIDTDGNVQGTSSTRERTATFTGTKKEPSETVQIIYDKDAEYSEMVEFASGDIASALAENGATVVDKGAVWVIAFDGIDPALAEQAYDIKVSLGKRISITGGDGAGLMYGGLEVAEMIDMYGLEGVTAKTAEPYVFKRGFQFNMPLDVRTPSYSSPGDAGVKNIENVWDIEFWHEFLDTAARMRYNNILFGSQSPFPSLVKVAGYEDVALDDVWRSTIPYDNSYKGDLTNIVRPEHWENYEVVKKMTIEEKIAFWKEVMAYAKSRGIDFYIGIHHMCVEDGEHGKYGITNDMDNEITKDYLRKSIQALIETYPLLKGVRLADGENMGWDNSLEGRKRNWQWLSDVYIPGINAALEKEPDRDFRLCIPIPSHLNEFADEYFGACLATLETNNGDFTGTHMYADSTPKNGNASYPNADPETKFWIGFRNEDTFDMRWGDVDFMRDFVHSMADKTIMEGFTTGFDGYCLGRDYSSTDPDYQGILYIKKHWYNYTLIGRLAFEPDLSDEKVEKIFAEHFDGFERADAKSLYEVTNLAGKIIPQVHKIYYRGNGDYTWYVAGCWSHPNTFGYIDITKWFKGNNVYQEGDQGPEAMSIGDYALLIAEGKEVVTDLQTPIEVAENLRSWSEQVLEEVSSIRSSVKASKKQDLVEKDYWALLGDDEEMAYMGLFYSERILGCVDLRVFNETKDEKYRTSAVEHLQASSDYFSTYANLNAQRYVPQQYSRIGSFDILEVAKGVAKDVEVARNWKPRVYPKSDYHTPSKNEFFK